MIHKMGLTKCPYPYLKYFDVATPEQRIALPGCQGEAGKITSVLVGTQVMELEVEDTIPTRRQQQGVEINRQATVNYTMKLSFKLLYSTSHHSQMMVEEQTIRYMGHIQIPYYIDGTSIRQLHYQNKLKIEVFVEDVNVNPIKEGVVMLSPYVIVNLDYTKSPSLALVLGDELGQDNIYLAKEGGRKLLQRTSDMKTKHTKLRWSLYGQGLCYMKDKEPSRIYRVTPGNQEKEVFEFSPEIEQLRDYRFIGQEQLVVAGTRGTRTQLYQYDLQAKTMGVLTHAIEGESHTYPIYAMATDTVFFIKEGGIGGYRLCRVHLKTLRLEELACYEKSFWYRPTYDGKRVVIYQGDRAMHLLDTENLEDDLLDLELGKATIKFMCLAPRQNVMALVLEHEGVEQIGIYDMEKRLLRILREYPVHVTIAHLGFDALGETLHIGCSDRGQFDLYTLDLQSKDVRLAYQCDAASIRTLQKWL